MKFLGKGSSKRGEWQGQSHEPHATLAKGQSSARRDYRQERSTELMGKRFNSQKNYEVQRGGSSPQRTSFFLLTVIVPGKRVTKNGLNLNMLKERGEGPG